MHSISTTRTPFFFRTIFPFKREYRILTPLKSFDRPPYLISFYFVYIVVSFTGSSHTSRHTHTHTRRAFSYYSSQFSHQAMVERVNEPGFYFSFSTANNISSINSSKIMDILSCVHSQKYLPMIRLTFCNRSKYHRHLSAVSKENIRVHIY